MNITEILAHHAEWLAGYGGEKANLGGANLTGANLRRAELRKADLHRSDLHDCDLRESILCEADMHGADLSGADLGGANLAWANLGGANLCRANLAGVNWYGAYLKGADLSGANGVATRGECIAHLDAIREQIFERGGKLDMRTWHVNWYPSDDVASSCDTAHCLAGWAQILSADRKICNLDPLTAAVRLIPLAAGRFWDSDEKVLEWLKSRQYAKEVDR